MQERRLFPRYMFERQVQLRGPRGETFDARGCDLSIAGIGLQLRRPVVQALAQGGSVLTIGDPFELILSTAGDHARWAGLTLACRVKHVRRLSQEEYLVAAWFSNLDSAQKAALETLLERIRPPGMP